MPTGSGTTRVVPLAAGVEDALKDGRTSSCIEQESSDVLQSRLEDAMEESEIRVECSVVCIMERFKGFSAGRKSALRPLAEPFEGRKASPKNQEINASNFSIFLRPPVSWSFLVVCQLA